MSINSIHFNQLMNSLQYQAQTSNNPYINIPQQLMQHTPQPTILISRMQQPQQIQQQQQQLTPSFIIIPQQTQIDTKRGNNLNLNQFGLQSTLGTLMTQCQNQQLQSVNSVSPSFGSIYSLPSIQIISPSTSSSFITKEPESCCCSICGKHFKNTLNLLLHQINQHSNNKTDGYPSYPHCGNLKQRIKTHQNTQTASKNAFGTTAKQSRHDHKSKSEKQLYKCNVCFKSFANKHRMDVHRNIHSGERQYVCTICNTSYRLLAQQKDHMEKMHPMVWNTMKHRVHK